MGHEPFFQTKMLFGMISVAVRRLPKKTDATIPPNSQASKIQRNFHGCVHRPSRLHRLNSHPKIHLPLGPARVSLRAVRVPLRAAQEQNCVRQ
jgi:hypothetical protein